VSEAAAATLEPRAAGSLPVVQVAAVEFRDCVDIAARFGVELVPVAAGQSIPGTYWGEPEAGLIASRLYVRADTPVHSLLHELSHFVCMSPARRQALDTNAGGTVIEECAVCYLQLLLAAELPGFGFERALHDMDAWGYSFREGPAAAWFAGDGSDGREWLERYRLIDAGARVLWRVRESE